MEKRINSLEQRIEYLEQRIANITSTLIQRGILTENQRVIAGDALIKKVEDFMDEFMDSENP